MNMIQFAALMKCILRILTVALLSVLSFCSNGAETMRTIRGAAELTATMWEGNKNVPFDLTATVILPLRSNLKLYAVKDETGTAILNKGAVKECALQPGDRIHVTGICGFDAMCKTITVLSHGEAPQPKEITAVGIAEGRYDNHFVRLTGTVRDAFRDETGSIICRELLGLAPKQSDSPVSEARTAAYYQKRPCAELVALAAKILSEHLPE